MIYRLNAQTPAQSWVGAEEEQKRLDGQLPGCGSTGADFILANRHDVHEVLAKGFSREHPVGFCRCRFSRNRHSLVHRMPFHLVHESSSQILRHLFGLIAFARERVDPPAQPPHHEDAEGDVEEGEDEGKGLHGKILQACRFVLR